MKILSILLCTLAGALPVARLAAQGSAAQPNGIWSGVYTAAQVERAKAPFTAVCRRCHNDDLGGSERGPALRGERFMTNWETQGLNQLFAKIRDTMPPDSPSSLPDTDYLDLVTLILQANGFPSGDGALSSDKLGGILLVSRSADGSTHIPNFRLVEIVGCLEQGPGTMWQLTRAGEPALTTDQASTPSASAEAAARPLGSQTFRLVGTGSFSPATSVGQKMRARGLIYRAPDKDRINLVSLEMVGPTCAP